MHLLAPDMLPCCALVSFSGGASWGFGEDAINEDDDCEWWLLRWRCWLDWAVVEALRLISRSNCWACQHATLLWALADWRWRSGAC